MDRRGFVVDGAVALAAFAMSAAIIAAAGADPDIRDPDALALALVAAHSASVVLRRPRPVAAVALSLASGLAYSAAKYPPALVPVVLLTVFSAAAAIPERPSRRLLVVAFVVSALTSTVGPGPRIPACRCSWPAPGSSATPSAPAGSTPRRWRPRTASWNWPSTSWPARR